MPLLVSDYSWTQTDSTVYINVPLKGAKARNVDIVCTEEYLKVSFPPYLFESFLFEPVDEDRSSAKVGNGVALISLPKKTNKHWHHSTKCVSDDKEKNKEIRERALLRYQEKLSSESRQKAEKQQKEKKYALETMMKWLNKQAEARRTVNSELVEELKDLTEEQRNPDWLKDKGE
uniref:Dynein axonemal assembly factor 4 n=1 Tax=Stegastes partitus TaxID=144197 RepID=A0A3B5AAG7_9TELE